MWRTEEFVATASVSINVCDIEVCVLGCCFAVLQGKCGDGNKVQQSHNYKQAKFDRERVVVINKVLHEIRSSLQEVVMY